MSTIDIKKVIESIPEKNNPQVYPSLIIKNVSVAAAKDPKVRYWVTLTVDKPIRGSYVKSIVNDVRNFETGLTTTITVPIGSVITVLFDGLFAIDDDTEIEVDDKTKVTLEDCAADLLSAKKALIADFEKTAAEPTHRSMIASLLIKSTIGVISRDVFKEDKTIKSLFSLNDKENEIERDSVWHDIYNVTSIRSSKIVAAWKKFCVESPAVQPVAQPANPLQALLAALGGAGNANVANAALA